MNRRGFMKLVGLAPLLGLLGGKPAETIILSATKGAADVPQEFLHPTPFRGIFDWKNRIAEYGPISRKEVAAKMRAARRDTKFALVKETKDERITVTICATKSNRDAVPLESLHFARHPRRKG